MKALLMGFEPFGGEAVNPSWEVAQSLSFERFDRIQVISRRLPTVFGESIDQAIEAISTVQPDVVIALGQAGGRTGIGLERVALNIDDAAIADNNGNQPCDAPIMEGAPAAYFATLPIKVLVEEVQKAGIPAATSNSAGTFVCNHTMYGILHYINESRLPIRAGFIHLPYLPEQAASKKEAPSMSLAEMLTALRVVLTVLSRSS